MISWLPTTLLIFLFASPVFSEPTSPNDPFRAIVLQVPKVPEPPICCLKPLTPLEPVDDEVLLSFEEWKTRQTAMQANSDAKAKEGANRSSLGAYPNGSNGSEPMPSLHDASPFLGSKAEEVAPEHGVEVSPHFRVPLTDRFNYASLDCSARVHTSHRSAKSASSILSSKRDRYMLSPCNSSKEKKFVVVELCDDIRIDTVQLANLEFFSGVFKDFSVSVAKTYSTDVDGWTHVGTYKAKNVRAVQSFHPPTSLRDFYRYIRIDFETYYGNEYFCPVSLLRVYGLTHLEQWKWDIWEAESRVKQAEPLKDRKFTLSNGAILEDSIPTQTIHSNNLNASIAIQTDSTSMVSGMDPIPEHITVDKFASHSSVLFSSSVPSTVVSEPQPEPTATLPSMETAILTINGSNDPTSHILSSPSTNVNPPSPSSNIIMLSSEVNPSQVSNIPISSSGPHSPQPSTYEQAISNIINVFSAVPSHSSPPPAISGTHTIGPSSPSVAVTQVAPSAAPPTTRGAESIYSTIMNRLTAIESNHTLYTRYIDQQNGVIREVIKRLGEDVGRLEGISRAQTLMHQRTVNDWEMQRYQLEMEYHDLRSRIENLSEEIVLEKRLGVAQLCLLLAVLVFLGLTRGSRTEIEHGPGRFNSAFMKEWGKRHFSLSGDWTNRFKGKNIIIPSRSNSRSRERSSSRGFTEPQPLTSKSYASQKTSHAHDENGNRNFAFPSRQPKREPFETIQLNSASKEYYPQTGSMTTSRSRAPSLRSTPSSRRTQHIVQNKIITPRSPFRSQPLQRSNSQGMNYTNSWGVGNTVPKSAKKWARTAHLHEVRSAVPYSVFSSTGSGSGQRSKRGSSEHSVSRVGHDGAMTSKEFEFDSEDVFFALCPTLDAAPRRSARKGDHGAEREVTTTGRAEPKFPDGLLFKTDLPVDDGDPWVDTDSVDGSELGTDLIGEF